MGHVCEVVAPSLIPKRAGERVKTDRRDAVTLARLAACGRAGRASGVPDDVHEAMRDLVRALEAASDDLRKKRQQLQPFLLRHGRIFTGRKHWERRPTYAGLPPRNSSLRPSRSSSRITSDAVRDAPRAARALRHSHRGAGAGMVNGAAGCRLSGHARRLNPRRCYFRRRGRRRPPLR